jgi:GNAT superfamily N-acetyltransferase
MGVPISIRLDDDVRDELEAQARAHGIGLATLLRDLATQSARDARKARIREDSAAVGAYVAASPEARAFYEDWGTPGTDGG